MQKINWFLVIGVLFSIALTSCEPTRFASEDELLLSYYSQFPDSGLAQKSTYSFIEKTLVDNDIIPDTTTNTYNYTAHYILGNKVTPFEASLLVAEILEPHLIDEPMLGVDSNTIAAIANKYPTSTITRTIESLNGQPFSDSLFVEQLMRYMRTEDLNHPLYRHLSLLYIAKAHEKKAAQWNREYAPSGNSVFITRNNTLTFVIDSAGEVRYNDEPIALAEVGNITRRFMTQDSSKANWVEGRISLIGTHPINTGVIIIGVSANVADDDLIKVYEEINQVFTQKRKEASQKFFKKDYFKLSVNERSALQLLTRKWISIHELEGQPI